MTLRKLLLVKKPIAPAMIIQTAKKDIDTDRDLSPEERHIVQKLFCWRAIVDSIEEFREQTRLALQKGWNNSGPVRESTHLKWVIQQLEQEIRHRLDDT